MSERTAQSHTRKVRPRKVAVSKVTNARDALADWGRGMETYCLTFGQFSLMDAVELSSIALSGSVSPGIWRKSGSFLVMRRSGRLGRTRSMPSSRMMRGGSPCGRR